jgi:hypothetical protein
MDASLYGALYMTNCQLIVFFLSISSCLEEEGEASIDRAFLFVFVSGREVDPPTGT